MVRSHAPPHITTVLPLEVKEPPGSLQSFRLMTEKEIDKIISGATPKPCSLDPIPTWLLKSNIDIFTPIITRMVNKSLQLDYFTPSMKKVLVSFFG